MQIIRNKQYHEIDSIELHGTRIAARVTNRIRAKLFQAFKEHKTIDISDDIFRSIFLPLITASILADLRGRRRSFRFADESFNLNKIQLELAFSKHLKRVFKLPLKKVIKKKIVDITIEELPKEISEAIKKGKKIYSGGKKLKSEVEKTPIQQVGKKAKIKSVPEPAVIGKKKKFREILDKENERVKKEIKEKIKSEKKYVYDEIVRHLRTILKDVALETVKVVNWQEVIDRLNNNERSIKDIKSIINRRQVQDSTEKLITKLINKVERKIRDKKQRAKEEIKLKVKKEAINVAKKSILKPIRKTISQRISEKIFGQPRRSGSHRQYRSSYYYIAKSVQELEKGQRRRRQVEIGKHLLSSLGGIADLIGFLKQYNVQDIFVFLSELGGANFFPETYKIGGVVKAANYIGEVGRILEVVNEEEQFNKVKEYEVKRVLRLTQELQTIRKLFTKYHPPVFTILKNASQKTNDNLRQVINDLILQGVSIKEGSKVLTEAFAANGLSVKEPFRIETIFRTQSALAYSAGRWQSDRHPAIEEILWGYKYITVGDSRVRPQHRILHGVTLPKESEFWLYFWPPNGWNCRCSVISLFEPHKIVLPPEDWKGLAEIDKDFVFNAGTVFIDSSAQFAGNSTGVF